MKNYAVFLYYFGEKFITTTDYEGIDTVFKKYIDLWYDWYGDLIEFKFEDEGDTRKMDLWLKKNSMNEEHTISVYAVKSPENLNEAIKKSVR